MVEGAGCASKLAPAQLFKVLGQMDSIPDPNVLVGFETSDDAAVYRISEHEALVQTVDFFTPIVDDPYWYGAIAAANALSDVYAMGGRPLTALNVAAFSLESAGPEVWAEVLRGAFEKTKEAGAVVVGGHTVDDPRPKFGMAVTGLVNPNRMLTNAEAKPGQKIYLSKKLGVGIVATAAKFDSAPKEVYDEAVKSMATLNAEASRLAVEAGVRCATDVTGFGVAGHLWNIARNSGVRLRLTSSTWPLLPGLQALIEGGHTTGGGMRNRDHMKGRVTIAPDVPKWMEDVLFDPQTSGGLALVTEHDLPYPQIGEVVAGEPGIDIVL